MTPTTDRAVATPSARLSAIRRSAGERSFIAFCRTYLPVHFRLHPSTMHTELSGLLEGLCAGHAGGTGGAGRSGTRAAIAAPRGHAKSTLVSLAYVLWCALYGREPFIVLISHTIDQARDLLSL